MVRIGLVITLTLLCLWPAFAQTHVDSLRRQTEAAWQRGELDRALSLLLILRTGAQAVTDSLRGEAEEAYAGGEFDRAELTAMRGDNLAVLGGLDSLARSPFHLVLGRVRVLRDQPELGKQEFRWVMRARPGFELDALSEPSKIVSVWREARGEHDQWLRAVADSLFYGKGPADVRLAASRRSLVLPGWGQYYKRQNTKGSAIAAAQILSVAALIYMQAETVRRHNDYLNIKDYDHPDVEDRYQEYRRAYQTRNVVGYVTLGIYLFNYFDALYAPVRARQGNR